jgi:hypothetical protein
MTLHGLKSVAERVISKAKDTTSQTGKDELFLDDTFIINLFVVGDGAEGAGQKAVRSKRDYPKNRCEFVGA